MLGDKEKYKKVESGAEGGNRLRSSVSPNKDFIFNTVNKLADVTKLEGEPLTPATDWAAGRGWQLCQRSQCLQIPLNHFATEDMIQCMCNYLHLWLLERISWNNQECTVRKYSTVIIQGMHLPGGSSNTVEGKSCRWLMQVFLKSLSWSRTDSVKISTQ